MPPKGWLSPFLRPSSLFPSPLISFLSFAFFCPACGSGWLPPGVVLFFRARQLEIPEVWILVPTIGSHCQSVWLLNARSWEPHSLMSSGHIMKASTGSTLMQFAAEQLSLMFLHKDAFLEPPHLSSALWAHTTGSPSTADVSGPETGCHLALQTKFLGQRDGTDTRKMYRAMPAHVLLHGCYYD